MVAAAAAARRDTRAGTSILGSRSWTPSRPPPPPSRPTGARSGRGPARGPVTARDTAPRQGQAAASSSRLPPAAFPSLGLPSSGPRRLPSPPQGAHGPRPLEPHPLSQPIRAHVPASQWSAAAGAVRLLTDVRVSRTPDRWGSCLDTVAGSHVPALYPPPPVGSVTWRFPITRPERSLERDPRMCASAPRAFLVLPACPLMSSRSSFWET